MRVTDAANLRPGDLVVAVESRDYSIDIGARVVEVRTPVRNGVPMRNSTGGRIPWEVVFDVGLPLVTFGGVEFVVERAMGGGV